MINCFQFCLNLAFRFNLRRYNLAGIALVEAQEGGQGCDATFDPLVELARSERALYLLTGGGGPAGAGGGAGGGEGEAGGGGEGGGADGEGGGGGGDAAGGGKEGKVEEAAEAGRNSGGGGGGGGGSSSVGDDDDGRRRHRLSTVDTPTPKTWLERSIEHLGWAAVIRPKDVPAAVELGMALLAAGRGLHSSTSQLNLSRF